MRFAFRLALAGLTLSTLTGCSGMGPLFNAEFQGCGAVPTYRFGTTVSGELTSSDCAFRENTGKRVDFYQMTLTETVDEARIRAGNEGLDPVLVLYRRDGAELERNDDITPVLNTAARVQRRLEPGVYVIAVTSAGPGATGRYQLTSTTERP